MAISPSQQKRELYSDFRKDFLISPVNQDLARKTNEEAVKESILNLILTERGERFFRPNLGCDVRTMLFENISNATVLTIEEMIRKVIAAYEPRANVIDIVALPNIEGNAVDISITFNVINSERDIVLTTTLSRVR